MAGGSTHPAPSVTKAPTGIEGFDALTRGGLPEGRTTLLVGGPGSGKTVFALQTLVHGAAELEEPGIFVAFEERPAEIVRNASAFGWDLAALQERHLFFVDAYLSPTVVRSGEFELTPILASVKARADRMGARRIVFDGLDVLLTLLDDPVAERREVYRLHEWLRENGYTGVLTAKADRGDPLAVEPYGFMQFMVDCVVVLHHRLHERVSLRGLRVLKYRGTGFSANEFPLVIGSEGIEIAMLGERGLDYEVSEERVTSGVPPLDGMLEGGYYRGSTVLLTGAPGTAKTSLAAAFTASTAARGERALFVSFDEAESQILRNAATIGLDLASGVEAGLVAFYAVRSEARSVEEHLMAIHGLLRELRPTAMIVDPISAMAKSGGHVAALDASLRLLDMAKQRGITTVATSLLEGSDAFDEATSMDVSTLADVWIHLTYQVRSGERNRALSIIKARGTGHSNQVREVAISERGLQLREVFAAEGEVLMGTARWEKEAEVEEREAERRLESRRRRRRAEAAHAELQRRMEALRRELEESGDELRLLEELEASRRDRTVEQRAERVRMRGGAPEERDLRLAVPDEGRERA